jgi:pimeloyl-ACP methyl ester carboxylesterase
MTALLTEGISHQIKHKNGFKYIDEGEGEVLLLLHGLFGALSNWKRVTDYFSSRYRVLIPMLPIYELPSKETNLENLVKFTENFIEMLQIKHFTILGNSLGGHIALLYTLKNPDMVDRLVLTGSSGLFEDTMGGSYPKRGNYEFIKNRVEHTFFDPKVAEKSLIDEVFEVTKSNEKCLKIVVMARSAQQNNLSKLITNINIPTLLVWGLNDTITPPHVAYEFNRLLPKSTLRFIDKCSHAPMMEHPDLFNEYVERFLNENKIT